MQMNCVSRKVLAQEGVKVENFAVSFDAYSWIKEFFALNHMVYVHYLESIQDLITLESGIDVEQGINVGPGKFVKKNKRRAWRKCVKLCYKNP